MNFAVKVGGVACAFVAGLEGSKLVLFLLEEKHTLRQLIFYREKFMLVS